MNFTGERPTLDNEIESSRVRYKSVLPFCFNRHVVDFGCGIGVGSFFLSHFAKFVIGYDVSREAIAEALKITGRSNLIFTDNFDVLLDEHFTERIFCLVECLEHLENCQVHDLLTKIKNYDIVCTTPNGDYFKYHPQTIQERRGYHVWHYTKNELEALFKQYYSFVEVYAHIYDPQISQYTSYMIFATNNITWNNMWLTHFRI